jgi:heat shock protein HtpX
MQVVGLQTHIWSNNFKSMALLAMFPAMILALVLMIVIIFTIGSDDFLLNTIVLFVPASLVTLVLVLLWFAIAYLFNRQLIAMFTRARPLTRKEDPRIYNIVENLCISRGLPVPTIFIMDDTGMNAYASGMHPRSSVVAFSRGLLDSLDDEEIEAVAAHELTHIINRDVRLMVIAIIFVGIIQTMAEFIMRMHWFGGRSSDNDRSSGSAVLIILGIQILSFFIGYLFAVLVQLSISRKREYMADAGAVELTKKSEPLIRALTKISQRPQVRGVANQSVAQIFFENPISEQRVGLLQRIFATHPPVADRIKALQAYGTGV